MTCFKMSFVNICAYLLDECFEGKKMTLEKLFRRIFDIPGKVREEGNQRNIFIKRREKQPDIIKRLESALKIINNMGIKDMNGLKYNFNFM